MAIISKSTWNSWRKREDGAVTVDWVVLSAAVISLGILVVSQVEDASMLLSDRISEATVATLP